MSILDIFCDVDDFMILFERWFKEHVLTHKPSNRGCKATLSMSEVMTIIIWFHQSHYRDFKAFYEGWTSQDWLRIEKGGEAKKRNQSIEWLRFGKSIRVVVI